MGQRSLVSLSGANEKRGSVAVVGSARKDHVSTVNLLEGDDESEFMLERECAQRPEEIRAASHGFVPSVGGADEKGAARDRLVFEFLDPCGKRAAGELFAALIEQNAVATFRERASMRS